jgi:hypothetical protein
MLLTLKLCHLALPLMRPKKSIRPKGYWLHKENRREYLINYAKEAGFDPMVPANWQKVSTHKITTKGMPHLS